VAQNRKTYLEAFIAPPARIPFPLRVGLWVVKRRTGRDLLPPQLLAWYPKAALGSAVLEALITHRDAQVSERILKMVRMTVSFTTSCPFCVGLNSEGWEKLMTEDELLALQGYVSPSHVPSLTERERLAIEFTQLTSRTPLDIPAEFGARLASVFTEREIVILATTSAQVNYWARLIQGLGCPPLG